MATSYTGLRVQDTYNAIIKIGDNSNLTGTAKLLSDGLGNASSVYLSTTRLGIGITPTYQFQTSGNAKIGGNLIIAGDLTVNGTTTIIDSTIIAIGDNMIEMAKGNTANTKDIGWYGKIVSTGTKYVGMAYDASTGVATPKFNLGFGTVEPGNTFATTVTGTLIANLEGNVTGNLTGNVTGDLTGSVTGGTISGTTGVFSSYVSATDFRPTNIVTNKIVKFSGTSLDDSIMSDDGTTVTIAGALSGTTGNFTGLVSGIAPTSDLNFATKKYVDDNTPTVTTPALSAVLNAGNTSGSNDLLMDDGQKLLLGDDSDIEIFHSVGAGYLINQTGNLFIENLADDRDIQFIGDDGTGGSAVYFFMDGSEERTKFLKNLEIVDNNKLILGSDDDSYLKWDTTDSKLQISGQSKFLSDATFTGDVYLTDGTNSSTLQFENDAKTRKIVLYEGADNDYQFYGFGVESSTLVYSTYSSGDDHVFFVGVDSTSRSELMRIKSTGDVNVANDIFSEGLYVNSNSAVSGTQVAIVKDGDQNLQRWGTATSGQASYRFRIDQDMKFIANSGSGDNLTIFSDTGNLTTTGQVDAYASTFRRGSGEYAIRLDSTNSTTDNDLRFAKGGTDYGAIQTNGTSNNFEFYVNDGTNWLNTLYFDRATGTTEIAKTLRVGGDTGSLSTGVGLELRYNSTNNISYILSYDRGNSVYKDIRLVGSNIEIETSGSIFGKLNHTFSYMSNADSGNHEYTNLGGRLLTSNGTNWDADGRDPILTLSSSGNSDSTEIANSIGLNLYSNSNDDDTFSPAIAFSGLSNSTSYASAYGIIIGKKTGQANDSNWNAGELQFYTGKVGAYMSNVPDLRIDSAGNAYFAASITVAGGTVFNSNITVQGNLTVDGTTLLKSNTKITNTGDVEYLTLNTASTTNKRIRLQFTQNDNAGVEIGTDYSVNNSTNFYLYDRTGGVLMAYFDTGKSYFPTLLGIGTDSPTRGLSIAKSNQYASLEIIKGNTGNQIVYLGTGSSGGTDDSILQLKHNGTEEIRLYTTGDSWINGGNLGVGTGSTIDSKLHVQNGSAGSVTAYTNTTLTLESSATDNFLSFLSPAGENQGILFGDADANWRGQVRYDHGTDAMQFYTAATSALTINSSQDATFTGNVTADYGYFNAESLSHDLRVGGIYANLGLYVPDTYDMQFSIGTTASNWKFTLANITKFLITPNGDVTANGSIGIANKTPQYGINLPQGTSSICKIGWTDATPTFAASIFANSSTDALEFNTKNASNVETKRMSINLNGRVTLTDSEGIQLSAKTGTLYATDGALSYYSASNAVYLNGAGASGWLRLNASGVENDRNAINIYGSAGDYMNFRTANSTRLLIDASGNATFYEDIIVKGGYNVDGGWNIGTWSANAAYNFIGTNNMISTEYCMITNGLSTYIGAASGGDTTIRCNANDSSHQLAITPNGAVFSGNTGFQNTSPQFWLHSGTTVAIPNSRYLNFGGTSNTEIPQSGFRQSFVCSYNDSGSTFQPKTIGIILHNESTQDNNFTPMLAFGAQSNSTNYSQVVAGIAGKRLGQAGDANWSAGELWFWTGRSDTISGTNQGLPAQNPAMVMSSTRHIGIGTNTPTQGKLEIQQTATTPALWVQTGGTTSSYTVADFRTGTNASALRILGSSETVINSLGFKSNRINSGYGTAANDADIWINYEGYLNSNSYYRDFRVGNGRNGQIMMCDGSTSKVAVGLNATTSTARFHVLNNGNNGSGGESDYGILAEATSGQATIGAVYAGDGYANLNLGSYYNGSKVFWHISKRLSSDAHNLEYYYYNGSSFALRYTFTTGGNFSATGSITASGDVIAFSDKKVKTNIKTIDNALEKVSKLRGVSYNRTDIDDKSDKIGVIAQEVKEVLPEVVSYDDEKDLLGVDYGKMAGVFIEAIKELKAEVNSLKQEIKELKK